MSSSSSPSATAPASRSPSPSTPDALGQIDALTIQSDAEHTSWLITSDMTNFRQTWGESIFSPLQSKSPDGCMLPLDDIIEPHAYHEAPSPCTSSSQISSPQPHIVQLCGKSIPEEKAPVQDSQTGNFFMASRNTSLTLTKPEPPPALPPRKPDLSSLNNRIVTLPKESCLNFPLIFPNIPEGGTKSRVETQVRVTVDLADPSSITEPYKYDRIGSWQWLKLPPGTATKRRTRKQGKIDPSPHDTLYLQAYVICASPPNNRVFSCTSCQTREAKRVAKKLAARVRPARSDSDSIGDPSHLPRSKHHEDTTSIIQFNCAEVLEFSTGSIILPLRITCYCRHHREKVGFLVNMQMLDHTGRVVACGQTRPIMITDDHKTTAALQARNGDFSTEAGWPQLTAMAHNVPISESSTSGRNNRRGIGSPVVAKKRPKPYDTKSKPTRSSREGSASTPASPSTTYSALPGTRSPTPSNLISQLLNPDTLLSLAALREVGDPSSCPSPDIATSNSNKNPDVLIENDVSTSAGLTMVPTHPMPLMFFDSAGIPQLAPSLAPTIHRLIPNMGPTHGGIEVTILGANFHANEQLTCIFGGTPACSTQRWSDNTLVCILPPRSNPGVVAVWIDKYQEVQPNAPTPLFTYSDETDRTLMELALQVVGLKMTGKIEDAKDIAMRIVGSAGETTEAQATDNPTMMQIAMANPASTRNVLPLLMNSGRDTEKFEDLIMNFLTLLDTPVEIMLPSMQTTDVISHTSTTGQTLLHYAAFLGCDSLSRLLISHKVDIDARDRNGFTALHFAALSGSVNCIRLLLEAGADRDIVNATGKTPAEIAQPNALDLFQAALSDSDDDDLSVSDEEAVWGDGEEDANVQVPRPLKRLSRRNSKRNLTFQPLTPAHSDTSGSTPLPSTTEKAQSNTAKGQAQKTDVDLKQRAWLTEVLQRTLAQLQAPQGIISNIPQLPLPNIPHLSDLRTVHWNSLAQIPVVFPIFVPMPGWPSFLQGNSSDKDQSEAAGRGMSAGAIRTAQELRATFDKWVAIVGATTTNQGGHNQPLDDTPPPRYTPRAGGESFGVVGESPSTHQSPDSSRPDVNRLQPVTPSEIRPIDYMQVPLTDQEVNAYAYAPSTKQVQKLQKKHDRMLIVFWLPILLLSCIWAFYSFVVVAFQAVKTFLPLKTPLRG